MVFFIHIILILFVFTKKEGAAAKQIDAQSVIAKPVLTPVVAIRFPQPPCISGEKDTDSHTGDIGHRLGMTKPGCRSNPACAKVLFCYSPFVFYSHVFQTSGQ